MSYTNGVPDEELMGSWNKVASIEEERQNKLRITQSKITDNFNFSKYNRKCQRDHKAINKESQRRSFNAWGSTSSSYWAECKIWSFSPWKPVKSSRTKANKKSAISAMTIYRNVDLHIAHDTIWVITIIVNQNYDQSIHCVLKPATTPYYTKTSSWLR